MSIVLDDVESELVFIDHTNGEMSVRNAGHWTKKHFVTIALLNYFLTISNLFQVENTLSTYDPHACVVVYSVTDSNSFALAEDIMVRQEMKIIFNYLHKLIFICCKISELPGAHGLRQRGRGGVR